MIIALAGRPNVGKSSLFNRLTNTRRALVWNQEGVTRDLIRGTMQLTLDGPSADITAELWDLAGWGRVGLSFQNLSKEVSKRIDLVLFVVDGSTPLTADDFECLQAVRKMERPILFVLNKADRRAFDDYSNEIYEHARADSIHFVSAETKLGLGELRDVIAAKLLEMASAQDVSKNSPAKATEAIGQRSREVLRTLILGRPNVGKSSLMNRLSEEEIAFVSDQPGTTRDFLEAVVKHRGQSYLIRDTAGIRKKSKVYGRKESAVEIFSVQKALHSLEDSDLAIFVIEATEDAKLTTQDRKLLDLVRKSLLPTVVVVNKWDLVRKTWKEADYRKELRHQFGDLDFLPVLFVSAKTGFHAEKIFQILSELRKRTEVPISTPRLNRFLERILLEKPPRVAKRGMQGTYGRTATRYLTIHYGVQTDRRPMTFQFFCNAPWVVAEDDQRFFMRKIREEFHLVGIPIKIVFRSKAKKAS